MSDKFIPGISQHIPIKMTWWDKLKSKWKMRKYSKLISKQAKAKIIGASAKPPIGPTEEERYQRILNEFCERTRQYE